MVNFSTPLVKNFHGRVSSEPSKRWRTIPTNGQTQLMELMLRDAGGISHVPFNAITIGIATTIDNRLIMIKVVDQHNG